MRRKALGKMRLAGALRLREAADVRDQLLRALSAGPNLQVDLAAVEALDASIVQILIAARRSAEAKGGAVRFTPPPSEGALGETLARLGLTGAL